MVVLETKENLYAKLNAKCFADISHSNQVHLSWIVRDLGFVHLLAFKNEHVFRRLFLFHSSFEMYGEVPTVSCRRGFVCIVVSEKYCIEESKNF